MSEQEKTVSKFVYEVRQFEDNLGQRFVERRVVSGKPPEGFVPFVGFAQLNVTHPVHGPLTKQFSFPIDTDTPERASEMFAAQAQVGKHAALAELSAELRSFEMQQTAQQLQAPQRLLDAHGRPL